MNFLFLFGGTQVFGLVKLLCLTRDDIHSCMVALSWLWLRQNMTVVLTRLWNFNDMHKISFWLGNGYLFGMVLEELAWASDVSCTKPALIPNSTFEALSTTLAKLVCDAIRSINW